QLQDGVTAYNITRALNIFGRLDVVALNEAFNHLLQRHESLRTSFLLVQGLPRQVIREVQEVTIQYADMTIFRNPEMHLLTQMAEASRQPFNLETDQLIKPVLFSVSANRHVLLINMHHIITDGWSLEVLTREWMQLYNYYSRGVHCILDPLSFQYKDYAAWHN